MVDADEKELKRRVVVSFVKAIGGGKGNYGTGDNGKGNYGTGDNADKTPEHKPGFMFNENAIFVQEQSPQLPSDLFPTSTGPTNLGLGFGRIRFADSDHLVPYIRVPWKQKDDQNKLRAQVFMNIIPRYYLNRKFLPFHNKIFFTDFGSLR